MKNIFLYTAYGRLVGRVLEISEKDFLIAVSPSHLKLIPRINSYKYVLVKN